jgi:hypothetical protein
MSVDWDLLIENHLDKGEKKMSLDLLMESIGEVLAEVEDQESFLLSEQQGGGRFSVNIPVPKLIPTEAWGDPKNMSRQEINKIFNVFRRAGGVRERIEQVNSFLDPVAAKRKAPGGKVNTLLRMMQVIEALQAAINDYSESSAGFVFEGFMAALTGGRQEAGRVGGTLPIEDFITGKGENVSLKLLSPGTGIHGSFTNLVDYLFIRGNAGVPDIKYLVAYKDSEGDDVSKLAIYDFVISRENFVQTMLQSGNKKQLGKMAPALESHIANWQDSPEWRLEMAELLKQTPGYDQRRGMFITSLSDEGERIETDEEPGADLASKKAKQYQKRIQQGELVRLASRAEDAGAKFARGEGPSFDEWFDENLPPEALTSLGAPKSKKAFAKFKQGFQDDFERGERREGALSESFFGLFDAREKFMLSEGKVGGDGGAQWTITGPSLQKIRSVVNTNYYGELDLSQKNVDELTKIYIEKLGEDVMAILNATKDFTENIGTYFATEDRSKAMNANEKAQAQGKEIVDRLATAAQPDKE